MGLLGALGGVEPPNFRNLPAFTIVSALTHLLPILFVPCLVPELTAFDEAVSDGVTEPTSPAKAAGKTELL